jgi:DNA-binding NarL/FixJ family response regulator
MAERRRSIRDVGKEMNATLVESVLKLRVAVLTPDAARAASLRTIVERAGHALTTPDAADVVLLDDEAGRAAAESVAPDKPVLLLGGRDRGRAGWLPTNAGAPQIDAALRAVAVGLTVRPQTGMEADRQAEPHLQLTGFDELPERASHALLTPREVEVLARVSAGSSNKVIARELGISLHTVKFHIESLFRKLGVRTRAEAVARALERRTIDI